MPIKKRKKQTKVNAAIYYLLLTILPAMVYFQSLNYDLVWDDSELYLNAQHFPKDFGLDNYLNFWIPANGEMYAPVTYTVWTAGYFLGSENDSNRFDPGMFHLLNVLFHILTGLLIFKILDFLINNKAASFIGALIFLLHPIQAEAVSWVSELRGVLAAFWGFLGLFYYLKYISNKDQKYYLISLITVLLSMLSKPSAVVFPLIYLLTALFIKRKSVSDSVKPLIIHFILAIPVIIISIIAESSKPADFGAPIWARPLIFTDAIVFYLYKIFLPLDLAADYGRKPEFVMQSALFWFSWIIPAGLLFWFYIKRKIISEYFGAFLIFICGFLTVSGLVSFYFQEWSTVADRYIYVSMFGISLAIAFLVKMIKTSPWIIAVPLILISGISAENQSWIWANEMALWSNNIEKYPDRSSFAYTGRGYVYLEKGDYNSALNDFNKAIDLDPENPKALYNRGIVYFDSGMDENALSDWNKAIDTGFRNSGVFANRGLIYMDSGRLSEAVLDFNKAIALDPSESDVYVNRGVAHAKSGNMKKAIADFKKALEINPNSEYAKENLNMAEKSDK